MIYNLYSQFADPLWSRELLLYFIFKFFSNMNSACYRNLVDVIDCLLRGLNWHHSQFVELRGRGANSVRYDERMDSSPQWNILNNSCRQGILLLRLGSRSANIVIMVPLDSLVNCYQLWNTDGTVRQSSNKSPLSRELCQDLAGLYLLLLYSCIQCVSVLSMEMIWILVIGIIPVDLKSNHQYSIVL